MRHLDGLVRVAARLDSLAALARASFGEILSGRQDLLFCLHRQLLRHLKRMLLTLLLSRPHLVLLLLRHQLLVPILILLCRRHVAVIAVMKRAIFAVHLLAAQRAYRQLLIHKLLVLVVLGGGVRLVVVREHLFRVILER